MNINNSFEIIKKLLTNKIFFTSVNIFCLLLIAIFIYYKFRFSLICNDDIFETMLEQVRFAHGRLFPVTIVYIFIRLIPDIFNINYQDFAFVALFLKTLITCFLIYTVTLSYFKFKPQNFSIVFLSVITFLTLFSTLIQIDFVWAYDTFIFFIDYIGVVIVYLLAWYKLSDIYINKKPAKKNDIFILCLLSFLIVQCNELLYISFFILLLLLFIESHILKLKNNKYIVYPLIVLILTFFPVIFSNGSKDMLEAYNISIFNFQNIFQIKDFTILFLKKIFIYNLFLIIPIIFSMVLLYLNKEKQIFKYFLYSNMGFLLFLYGTILLPKTCVYTQLADKWWFLCPGLMIGYSIFLYSGSLFLLGYISILNIINKLKYLCIILFCTGCLSQIIIHFDINKIICLHSFQGVRKMMYIDDKLSLFYINKGKTIVLPAYQPFYLLPDVHPYDLAASPEFYSQIFDKNRARYLIYLENNYNVKVNVGVTFKNNETAINEYLSEGGILTKEELRKLNFSDIKQ